MSTVRVVSVSGGKDSTATALLALDADADVRLVFADTGNEHELTLEHVYHYLPTRLGVPVETVRADFRGRIESKRRYIAEQWPRKGVPAEAIERALSALRPFGVPFLDLCLWKGRFPSRMAQFCTQELKRYPLEAHLLDLIEDGHAIESWRGVRRDESRNRQHAQARSRTAEGYEIVLPIVDWTAPQVVAFCQSRGVELNPLYRLGMGRVGCMPCINVGKDELSEIGRRFPAHIDRIREWERLVSDGSKLGWSTFFTDGFTDGETHAEIYNRLKVNERVRWSMTSRGGKQLNMLRMDEPAACASLYGLCE